MLRSLLRQLVLAPLPDKLKRLWNHHCQYSSEPSDSELLDVIAHVVAHEHVFLVIDALEEYPEYPEDKSPGRSTLLETISQLSKMHQQHLHLVVTSRRESDICKSLECMASFSIDVDQVLEGDVRKFVDHAFNHEPINRWGTELISLATQKLLHSEERYHLVLGIL